MKNALEQGRVQAPKWSFVDPGRRLVLVTAHRRESFGAGIEHICDALVVLAQRDDIQLVYPVHPNPKVMDPVYRKLSGLPRVELIEPLDYVPLIDLMMRSHFILTDSGGIQEEAPSLGKPPRGSLPNGTGCIFSGARKDRADTSPHPCVPHF